MRRWILQLLAPAALLTACAHTTTTTTVHVRFVTLPVVTLPDGPHTYTLEVTGEPQAAPEQLARLAEQARALLRELGVPGMREVAQEPGLRLRVHVGGALRWTSLEARNAMVSDGYDDDEPTPTISSVVSIELLDGPSGAPLARFESTGRVWDDVSAFDSVLASAQYDGLARGLARFELGSSVQPIELEGCEGDPRFARGISELRRDRLGRAAMAFESLANDATRARTAAPRECAAAALYDLGVANALMGRFGPALRELRLARGLRPDDWAISTAIVRFERLQSSWSLLQSHGYVTPPDGLRYPAEVVEPGPPTRVHRRSPRLRRTPHRRCNQTTWSTPDVDADADAVDRRYAPSPATITNGIAPGSTASEPAGITTTTRP